jgi:hypothetical protein
MRGPKPKKRKMQMSDERVSGSLGERLAGIIAGTKDTGWRIIQGGKEVGPFSDFEMVEKAAAGQLAVEDLVKQGDGLWTKAREVAILRREFELRESREKAIAKIGEFNGVWVSKPMLIMGACLIVLLVLVGWLSLRAPEKAPAALAKEPERKADPEKRADPHIERPDLKEKPKLLAVPPAPKPGPPPLTEEDKEFIRIGAAVKFALPTKPLVGVGDAYVSVVASPAIKEYVSEEEIRTRAELRLRQFGFKVQQKSRNAIFVEVFGVWQSPTQKSVMGTTTRIALNRRVFVETPEGTFASHYANAWEAYSTGATGNAAVRKHVEEGVDSCTDKFLNDYLDANPK